VYGGIGNGTTVQAYVGVRNSGVWSFEWGMGEAEAEIRKLERREKVEGTGGLAGVGESGSIPATQVEIVVLVLDRGRKIVLTVAFDGGGSEC
jgi:hypothetical protein